VINFIEHFRTVEVRRRATISSIYQTIQWMHA